MVDSILMRTFGHPMGIMGRLGGIVMARMNKGIYRRAIDLLSIQPADRVLEIGFGPGVGIELLSRSASSGQVVGIDPSEEMVQQASSRNKDAIAAGRVDLRLGSVERLPFQTESFDKALAVNSMQVWPDAFAGLREIRRVVRPSGRVVLCFTRHSGQEKKELYSTLKQAGLTEVHIVDENDGFCVSVTRPNREVRRAI